MAVITEEGVKLRSLADTVLDNSTLWTQKTGDVDIAPSSATGELIAIKSETDTRFEQDLAAAFVNNTVMADGINLDQYAERKGVYRRLNVPTVAVVSITGVNGTIILEGTSFTCSANDEIFTTQYQVMIAGGVAQVAVSSENYGVTCPAQTLELTSEIVGITTATNTVSGVIGYETESDESLRERLQLVGTEQTHIKDGLYFALLLLNGVSFAKVIDNNTDAVMHGEIPARYFSAIIIGGNDIEVANTVYDFMQNGNPSFGEQSLIVSSKRGQKYPVYFTRAIEQSVTIVITLTTDADFDDLSGEGFIINKVVEYTNSLKIGETLYKQKVEAICFIDGVTAVSVTLDGDTLDIVPNYKTKLATNNTLVSIAE